MLLLAGEPPHLVQEGKQRLLGRVGVDRSFACSTSPDAALDPPAQEVEALVDVADSRFLARQAQADRGKDAAHLRLERFCITRLPATITTSR